MIINRPLLQKIFLVAGFFLVMSVNGLDFTIGTAGEASTETKNPVFVNIDGGFSYTAPYFSVKMLMELDTNGNYSPFIADYWGDMNFTIKEASLKFTNEKLKLSLGIFESDDAVDSPYSLFLNENTLNIPTMNLKFTDDGFFFDEYWFGLNKNSAYYTMNNVSEPSTKEMWPNRSLVLKTYGLKFEKLRMGFQDVTLTSSSYFDFVDVFVPAPGFFLQYIPYSAGRPWSEDTKTANKNSIIGFFADYQAATWYAYAQVLIDDFNPYDTFKNDSQYKNPDKVAASIGGNIDFFTGKLGCYIAGATKYTFQSYGDETRNVMYGYSLFPVNAYYFNNEWNAISVQANSIGYINGENDLSVMLSWQGVAWNGNGILGKLLINSNMSFSITGEQSPGNPWHESATVAENHTEFLTDPVLRKRVVINSTIGIPVFDIAFLLSFSAGYEWNKMELVYPAGSGEAALEKINGQPYFVPGSDCGFIGNVSLGLSYTLKF